MAFSSWNIHRVDYQQTLAKCAQDNGVEILFDAEVKSVDMDTATVTLADGREMTADLIVGADGMLHLHSPRLMTSLKSLLSHS